MAVRREQRLIEILAHLRRSDNVRYLVSIFPRNYRRSFTLRRWSPTSSNMYESTPTPRV